MMDLEVTAYHEAAHAVMQCSAWRGHEIECIRIWAEGEPGNFNGMVQQMGQPFDPGEERLPDRSKDLHPTEGPGPKFTKDAPIVLHKIMTSLAGGLAQAKVRDTEPDWKLHVTDCHEANRFARGLCMKDDEIEAFLKWMEIRTRRFLLQPKTWLKVEAVAKAVLNWEPERYEDVGRDERRVPRKVVKGIIHRVDCGELSS